MRSHPPRRSGTYSRSSGFTLLELLLVIVIIGVLAATVVPSLVGRSQEARVAAARQDIRGALGVALDLYEQDTGGYPTTEQGLEALVSEPPAVQNWHGPYIKSAAEPVDPWGNRYRYAFPSSAVPTLYELTSAGPDGEFGTDDDITSLAKRQQ